MIKRILYIFVALLLLGSCGIYSFSGTSIAPDVESITIYPVENRALRINPRLSNNMTEALMDKFRKLTKLRQVPQGGDLVLECQILNYETASIGVTADEVASKNRLTVTMKVVFTNVKYPKESFDRNFAAFEDYPSTVSFDAAEANLVEQIIEKLTEDIFNSTVANW
jgi:hypothetical protein